MSFVIISVSPAFGQELLSGQVIILNTDKSAYNDGDIITLTGSVEKVVAGLDTVSYTHLTLPTTPYV